ncbi:MAG: GIY-YIG nuclease family protein [Bacteroidetes bacterium]|nr:GIY-YIG nuclease family protein [Bacteroidota bacterium]
MTSSTLVRGTKKAPKEWSFFYFIMITVYVLRSLRSEIYYTGMTQNLDNRLKEHNSGKSKFTSGHLPWTVIYSELLLIGQPPGFEKNISKALLVKFG